ncbi:MAG: hypothetical protein EDM74_04510 [Armatimonadetes bacterium]|nr:MAG: hypothetical protein EDM74_04510 [Armatimonadota bacterium]
MLYNSANENSTAALPPSSDSQFGCVGQGAEHVWVTPSVARDSRLQSRGGVERPGTKSGAYWAGKWLNLAARKALGAIRSARRRRD